MKRIPDDMTGLEYCQANGLRILASEAFKWFYNNLDSLPGNYLEIGVFEGFMLRALAQRYPDKTFYGIDPFIEDGHTTGHNDGVPKGEITWKQMADTHENIKGIPNIKFFQQTSRSWGEEHATDDLAKMEVGAVFVDGDHSTDEAFNDLLIATQLLPRGGVIYVDDITLPTVKSAVHQFTLADGLIDYEYPNPVMRLRPL